MDIKIPKPVGFLILMVILFALGYLIPYTFVLGKSAILEPDIARQFNIYSDIIFFLVGLVLLYTLNLLWKKNDKYGDNIGIYNKEETIFKRFTYGQITLLSLIFFSAVFLIANVLGQFKDGLFGLRVLPQQFSPVDSIVVSTLQIPIAENVMAGFTIGFIALLLTFLAVKYNWKPQDFKIYKYTAVTLGLALFGYIWHQTVYSNSQIAGITVAIFWGLGALLTLATGFFVPFLVMHMTNNFFIDFARLYSSDVVLGTAIGIIVLLGLAYFVIYRGRLLGE